MDPKFLDLLNQIFDGIDAMPDEEFACKLEEHKTGALAQAFSELQTFVESMTPSVHVSFPLFRVRDMDVTYEMLLDLFAANDDRYALAA